MRWHLKRLNLETHFFKIHTCLFVFVCVRAFLDNIVRVRLCVFFNCSLTPDLDPSLKNILPSPRSPLCPPSSWPAPPSLWPALPLVTCVSLSWRLSSLAWRTPTTRWSVENDDHDWHRLNSEDGEERPGNCLLHTSKQYRGKMWTGKIPGKIWHKNLIYQFVESYTATILDFITAGIEPNQVITVINRSIYYKHTS